MAFETTIAKTGAETREAHKAAANRDLAGAMSDKEFGRMLYSLGVKPAGGTGTPAGFRWHHAKDRPGTMQLVPEAQHTPGSSFQDVLHPGARGRHHNASPFRSQFLLKPATFFVKLR